MFLFYVYWGVHVCTTVCVWCPWRPENGIRYPEPELGITVSCHVGTGTQIQGLGESYLDPQEKPLLYLCSPKASKI